jgi:LPS export ABC transporter protein LptC
VIRRLLPLVLAAAAIVLAAQWSMESRDPAPDAQAAHDREPSAYLRDAHIEEFDRGGRRKLRVAARRIEQDPRDDSVALDDLDLEYLALEAQTWRMTARRGAAPKGFGTVILTGNVVMSGERDRVPRTATVRTDRLVLDTSSQVAHTRLPVLVTVGDNTLAAVGLTANLKGETLQLESEVHGNFPP